MEETVTVFQFLEKTGKAMTREELRKFNVETTRKELRDLERAGLIIKEEKYLHNSAKTYLKDKKMQKVQGTRVYTYKVVM